MFQSAPAPVGAGDDDGGADGHGAVVSIRARSRGSGRPGLRSWGCRLPCFNPRPLPWERATAMRVLSARSINVSIRARSRGSGRRGRGDGSIAEHRFQSAPAPVGAGDLPCPARCMVSALFQSAPAPVGAGDATTRRPRACGGCFNPRPLPWERATRPPAPVADLIPVSIRARSRGSGRPPWRACGPVPTSFQSAPAPVGAGDATTVCRMTCSTRFNPRPLPWERATVVVEPSRVGHAVSIRARSRGSGRRLYPFSLRLQIVFQSAPAPVGAGDRISAPVSASPRCFNPRPLPWERATIAGAVA